MYTYAWMHTCIQTDRHTYIPVCFHATAPTGIFTLSLPDALPSIRACRRLQDVRDDVRHARIWHRELGWADKKRHDNARKLEWAHHPWRKGITFKGRQRL